MRTKIILALFILLLTSAFIFEHSAEYYQPPPVPAGHSIADSFLIGAMDIGYESSRSVYNSLGFNVWHKYNIGADTQNGAFQIYGWTNLISNDVLTEPVGNYANAVLGIYNGNWSNNPRMWTIAERPKITRLCFGQRSDYQCETVTPYSCDKWYYSFQDHSAGTDVTDSCQTVRYCQRNENQTDGGADWVVRKLKCNNEQCNASNSRWEGDLIYKWIIKPRIRVDSAFVADSMQFNTPICRIDVYNWNNTLIKSTIIRCRHFIKNISNPYRGNYLEEYFFTNDDSTLTFPQTQAINFNPDTNDWAHSSRLNDGDKNNNHMDIQVYWYGNCDMWLDYVRVDNDIADNLFGTGQTHDLYMSWLQGEADIANNSSSPLKFYIELTEYNNIPCIAYVNHKLDSLTGGRKIDVLTDFDPWLFNAHLYYPDTVSVSRIAREYVQGTGVTQFFMETYPLTGDNGTNVFSKIPNTLTHTSGPGILATAVSPGTYDTWLQDQFDYTPYPNDVQMGVTQLRDEGSLKYRLNIADRVSKTADVPFINMPQGHLWKNYGWEVRREPTNEELDCMANLAVLNHTCTP